MRRSLALLLCYALTLGAQFSPPQNGPYKSLIEDAGADCIFALHADTISGMQCANATTDGTTETAFQNGVSIPRNSLSRATIAVASTFLVHTSGGATPSIIFGLRLGGINGTLIFQSFTNSPTSGQANSIMELNCHIHALATASNATPLVVGCANSNNLMPNMRNTLLTSAVRYITADVTSTKTLVWTVTYSVNTAGNAVGLYSMFNGIK